MGFAHLNDGGTNPDFGVRNRSVRRFMDKDFFRGECLLQKLDHLRSAGRMQIRHQDVRVFRQVTPALVGADIPLVAANICNGRVAIAIFLIGRSHQ